MAKILTRNDIIKMINEEWQKNVMLLEKQIDISLTKQTKTGKEDLIISPELKVLHKKSGIRYTVDSVSPKDVILRTPEGKKFLVHGDEFEEDYELS